MPQPNARWSGWRGVGLIAITYIYFLIFAQFAFLKRLASLDIADAHLKAVMGAMALGGIVLSLLTPRVTFAPSPPLRLRAGLAACGTAALITLLPLGLAAGVAASFLIGAGLGLLTVTLVTYLPIWLGSQNALLKVGLGTGLGYFLCNVPILFTASPEVQAVTSAILCLAGILLALQQTSAQPLEAVRTPEPTIPFFHVVGGFTALVWLDSAAFFIIQNTPALKAGTWEGVIHLWANGLLHLGAALASAWWLRRHGLSSVLSLAFLSLAMACWLLLDPNRAFFASAFYPVGVSLYSVALVAYPSYLAPASSTAQRGRQAGWIYAIAGWLGSAMGIGMGQNLGRVPLAFVLVAGVVVLTPQLLRIFRHRKRELSVTLATLVAGLCIDRILGSVQASPVILSEAERGRQVYISEGCINCHSQYVRPNTPDVLMWGPVQTLKDLRLQKPPLIGNRRQGPDLANVGSRRSTLWLKAHLNNPSELSHASFMPSYAHLFEDRRGDDVVTYLRSLQGGIREGVWEPSFAEANVADGPRLFNLHCATCHGADGSTRETWRTSFERLPPDLAAGPFTHLRAPDSVAERSDRLATIVKFGLTGSDMPGHEYLSDREITSLSLWLAQSTVQPVQDQSNRIIGEK